MNRCYACKNGKMENTQAELERHVGGHVFKAVVPAIRCRECGEENYEGTVIEAFDLAVAGELAMHGETSPDAFLFMRRVLGLKAFELAELLSVAHETISRWEHGHQPIDRGSGVLLAAMVLDRLEGRSTTFERLSFLRKPVPLPALVELTPRFA